MAVRVLVATAVFLTASITAQAALFSDNFDVDSSADWNINTSSSDTSVTFAFDYSTIGIPPSPNGGGTTLGLRMAANIAEPPSTEAVTLSPIGYNFTGVYILQFDMWINANGPFPGGGGGSTEFLTAGIGYDDTTPNLNASSGSGGWFAVSGEGGSSRDYRAYKNAGEQFAESGQFLAGTSSTGGGAHNASDIYYAGFGDISVPAAVPDQTDLHPQQTGITGLGTPAFAWHKVTVTVDGEYALWSIDDLPIAELNPAIGATFDLDGNISIGYMDPFTSISDNDALSFGIIDNLVVFADPASDYLAHNPTPADNEKRAPTTEPLEWEHPFEIDPIGYDVFLRTPDPNFTLEDRVVTDEFVKSYQPVEDELQPEVQYYWRVDVHDPNEIADANDTMPFWRTGTLWTFTTAPPEPSIEQQPQPVITVPAGDKAELSVVAINDDSYQWFRIDPTGGAPVEVPGATFPTLTIDPLQLTDEGYYYCVVKNKDGVPVESDLGRILTQRKMAHWMFDNDLTDEVDSANDGTSPAAMTYPAGIDGQAVKIAAPDQFIQIDNEIGLLNAVTVSLWVNPTAATLLDTALFLVAQDGGTGSIHISSVGNEFSAEVLYSGLDDSVPGLIADQWNHLVLVHDPDQRQARLYLNGVLAQTVTGIDRDILPNVTTLGIGARNLSDIVGIFEQGLIDDVRIYNYPISSLNAASLYTGFVPDASVCLDSVMPQYDLNEDCVFNLQDLAQIIATWLECNLVPDCIDPQLP